MSKSKLWEMLRPVAARMPRVVREHEVLRVSAGLFGGDGPQMAETARKEVLKWAQKRSGGRLPQEAWDLKSFEYYSGGRNSVGIRIENDGSDIWAIRADDPDKTIPGRIWTTEVVVGLLDDGAPKFSARLLASTGEDELEIEPHTPGLVQQVAESCTLKRSGIPLSAVPILISNEDEIDDLIERILDPSRDLPIFVLTVPQNSVDENAPLIDAGALARATLGTAQIVVLPASCTWYLTESFGRVRSVFGGAIRAYLPGFSVEADPYAHRLILADQFSKEDGVRQSQRWMRSLAATESVRKSVLGRDVLSFASIRNASLQLRQIQLAQGGASDSEQLAAANARIDALEKEAKALQLSHDYFDAEHKSAEDRAEVAEQQARASAFRVQELLSQIKDSGRDADASIELPDTWADFGNWCNVKLAGRVVLTPAANRAVRSPSFEDVGLAARCLLWLATSCRDRRMNGGEGTLREEAVEEGIRNAHCGQDQFDLYWQGQRYTADWHLKNGGNTRDPKRCLRIYYFWHQPTQQIVIAEMPAHRRTGAS